jgi:hypothetical protein
MEPIGLVLLFPGWGFPSHDPDKLLRFSDILDAMQLTCIFSRPDVSSFPYTVAHIALFRRECVPIRKNWEVGNLMNGVIVVPPPKNEPVLSYAQGSRSGKPCVVH